MAGWRCGSKAGWLGGLVAVGLTVALACGGHGGPSQPASESGTHPPNPGGSPVPAQGTGSITLALVNDGPAHAFKEVRLALAELELRQGEGAWLPLAANGAGKTRDLLNLKDRERALLLEQVRLPAGSYDQLRFRLGSHHYVKLQGHHGLIDLTTPNHWLLAGVRLDLKPNEHQDLVYRLPVEDGVVATGAVSGRYEWNPAPGHLQIRTGTGTITGKLVWAAGAGPTAGEPVAGATVMAQADPGDGQGPSLARTTTSRADGGYRLDLLPAGPNYRVVVAPHQGPRGHALAVSDPLSPGSGTVSCALHLEPLVGHDPLPPPPSYPGNARKDQVFDAWLLGSKPLSTYGPALPVILGHKVLTGAQPFQWPAMGRGPFRLKLAPRNSGQPDRPGGMTMGSKS